MFTKVSVLVPTRHRIGRLRTLLQSYEETCVDQDLSELVFRIDYDDQDTQKFLSTGAGNVVIGPRFNGYQSMPRFYNDMLPSADGDVLMCGNDDMIFRTPGWAQVILDVANWYPDGLFNIGVLTMNGDHFPFSTVSRKMTDRLGFIWDPRVFWGDIFLRDVAAHFGRCVRLPTVQIVHDWAGFEPDEVFMETRSSKAQVEGDESYWTGVHAQAVREAVTGLEGLMS